jgi:hypothetical protein
VDCQRRKKVILFPEDGTNETKNKVHVRVVESRFDSKFEKMGNRIMQVR